MGLAPDTPLVTKLQLAQRMLTRAAGMPLAWVTDDSVYGYSADLRRWLEVQGQSHVLAEPADQPAGLQL